MSDNDNDMVNIDNGGEMVTITLADLEGILRQDLAEHEKAEMKEKVESAAYGVCLLVGGAFLLIHICIDWIPFLVALPSARVLLARLMPVISHLLSKL